MSKQEFKLGQEVWVKGVVNNYGDILLGNGDVIDGRDFEGLIFKTEPQKPVIPKFVAEWIEECKAKNYGIGECLTNAIEYAMPEEVIAWFDSDKETEKDKDLLIARAYLDGYEIEQEKLYTVEIPNPLLTKSSETVTVLRKFKDGILLTNVDARVNRKHIEIYQLTEAEIRKDFDWAWQAGFAKEVE